MERDGVRQGEQRDATPNCRLARGPCAVKGAAHRSTLGTDVEPLARFAPTSYVATGVAPTPYRRVKCDIHIDGIES